MPKSWRWIAPIAVAGGLIASGTIPAAEASPAVASISINATSPNYPGLRARDHGKVDGFAVVIYQLGPAATAVISGTVTTTATTDTATLMAEPFGTSTYTAVGSPVTLTPSGGAASYSFNVTPSLATNYFVQLGGTDTAASPTVAVYVSAAVIPASSRIRCPTTYRCVQTDKVRTKLPAEALRTELRKHVYLYLAVGERRGSRAVLPKDYTLSTASRASEARRVNSGEYVVTLTFIVPIRNSRTIWVSNACAKDTEPKDGLGLPGHHGCGDWHVPGSAIYLG